MDNDMADGDVAAGDQDAMDEDLGVTTPPMSEDGRSTMRPGRQREPTVLKFELQVYKMPNDRLMVDFQRVDGGVMISLDIAAKLMKLLELH
jgi:5'-AMP-activated protein kinase catalytic alpha subunit